MSEPMEDTLEFLKDEIRSGFYIPTTLKQAWLGQLSVLEHIDRICEKYHISYFADWGTFLGAVRHGGFVPWDDDLDICMKRQDYDRFKEIAIKELPEGYCLHDYEHREDHWLFLTRVVNSEHICFEPQYLKTHNNFPYLSGIDIFVTDYQYRDAEKEKERCQEVKYLISVGDSILEGSLKGLSEEKIISELEKKYDTLIPRKCEPIEKTRALYRLAEKQMARVSKEESDKMIQLFPWGILGRVGYDKRMFERTVRIPFENTTIPVLADYDAMLRTRYGNYFEVHKVWNGHKFPFFESQKEELLKNADFSFPEFHFRPEMLRINQESGEDAFIFPDEIAADCLSAMKEMMCELESLIKQYEWDASAAIMGELQQLCVDLGTYTENLFGEESPQALQIVGLLESFLEKLYLLYESVGSNQRMDDGMIHLLSQMKNDWTQTENRIQLYYLSRKRIGFFPDSYKAWEEMKEIFEYYRANSDYELFIVPLPLFSKELTGEIHYDKYVSFEEKCRKDYEEYAKHGDECKADVYFSSHEQCIFENFGFERAYISNPYDFENPCLTVPPRFYASNLQKYSKRLIYCMPEGMDDFTGADLTDLYGLKHYLTMPAGMYADDILYSSENMEALYLDTLSAFSGEEYRTIWQEKLISKKKYYSSIDSSCTDKDEESPEFVHSSYNNEKRRKSILYCFGENEPAHSEDALWDLRSRLDIFTQYKEKLDCKFCFYPYSLEAWTICEPDVKKQIMDILDEYGITPLKEVSEKEIDSTDAYYGSASVLVHLFSRKKKPVMISKQN